MNAQVERRIEEQDNLGTTDKEKDEEESGMKVDESQERNICRVGR